EPIAGLEDALRVQDGKARGAARAARRAVDLPGTDRDGVATHDNTVLMHERRGELAERDVIPLGQLRMVEGELLVRRPGDPQSGFREVLRFVRRDRKAQ